MLGLSDDKPRVFSRRVAPGLVIVIIAIASIALMMVDYSSNRLSTLRSGLSLVLQPIQSAAQWPGEGLSYLDSFFDRSAVLQNNKALRQENLLLQGQLERLAALEAENARIRALLASASTINQNVLIAQIVAVSPDPYRQRIELNKGSTDGVFVGQTLIDAHGIMGQVITVSPLSSRAELISDPDSGVPVEINRTGLQTIVQGTGNPDQLKLPFLPNNANVKVGDLLVSSGLGGRYPADYPVARVASIKHLPGRDFLSVTARPIAHLHRGREVLLVWNAKSASDNSAPASAASQAASQTPSPAPSQTGRNDSKNDDGAGTQ